MDGGDDADKGGAKMVDGMGVNGTGVDQVTCAVT